jgi:hypothetical protein
MSKTILSFNEGLDLLRKLLAERIPLHALSMWETGSHVVLSGFVDSITSRTGIVISAARPPSHGPGFISVMLSGRNCEFSYCDKRELPPETIEFTPELGDTVLLLRFLDSHEILALTFTL